MMLTHYEIRVGVYVISITSFTIYLAWLAKDI